MDTPTVNYIELRRARDFGATINVIFEFLRVNWRPLGRSLLYIMTPVLLLATVATGIYVNSIVSTMGAFGPTMGGPFGTLLDLAPTLGLAGLAFGISVIFLFCIVGGFVRLYMNRPDEPITVDMVWTEVRANFWRVTGTLILSGIVIFAPLAVAFAVAAITQSFILLGLLYLLAIPLMIYLYNFQSIIVPMRLEEEIGYFEAFGRSRALMRERWWFTFGIFFVVQIILTFASVIFMVPLQGAMMVSSLGGGEPSAVIIFIGAAISTIGTYLLYAILVLACSVQYYNLVEQKEGPGMIDRIEEIGQGIGEARTGGI